MWGSRKQPTTLEGVLVWTSHPSGISIQLHILMFETILAIGISNHDLPWCGYGYLYIPLQCVLAKRTPTLVMNTAISINVVGKPIHNNTAR